MHSLGGRGSTMKEDIDRVSRTGGRERRGNRAHRGDADGGDEVHSGDRPEVVRDRGMLNRGICPT